MRKKIVAGNWKMNLLQKEAIELFETLLRDTDSISSVELAVFPGF